VALEPAELQLLERIGDDASRARTSAESTAVACARMEERVEGLCERVEAVESGARRTAQKAGAIASVPASAVGAGLLWLWEHLKGGGQ